MAENKEGNSLGTSWLLALGVLLYALFGWLGLRFAEVLRFPSDWPGGEPPWYFIRRDAIVGLCFLPYLLSCLIVGLIAARNKIAGGAMLVWFGVIWSAAPVWGLLVIYLRSDHIFDLARAQTAWSTFDSYLGDPLRWGWLILLSAGAILQGLSKLRSRKAVL